jgi:hypothetical protein
VALQVLERADQIDDAGDAEVFRCARAGFESNGAERRGAALGKHYAVDAGAIGHAKKCAEVLWVFHAIESENEAGCMRVRGIGREEVFKGELLLRTNHCDDALVRGGAGQLRELLTRFDRDADASLAALRKQIFQPLIAPLASHQHTVKAALARAQRFFNRVQAVQNFHRDSLEDRASVILPRSASVILPRSASVILLAARRRD